MQFKVVKIDLGPECELTIRVTYQYSPPEDVVADGNSVRARIPGEVTILGITVLGVRESRVYTSARVLPELEIKALEEMARIYFNDRDDRIYVALGFM